ncbi:MAG TPA: tetratricopeptide repeat protein, partial [Candidatus Binatia bacterium]|nr:tetratricopeptide repeat protein [Candidatus Binatia bacterium]
WCLWLDHRVPESAAAFRAATQSLPFSEDLAVAYFKLADALYQQGDYTNAVRGYRGLTNEFSGVPRIRDSLFDQALYQIVRASIETGDEAAASSAMERMLDAYPESPLSERSMWLVGQDFIRLKRPAQARQIFNDFLRRFPDRPLRPRVDLAVGRTYAQEGDWVSALSHYQDWLSRYPTNELRPRAEFNLAWANYRADRPTNAFELFTNFVAQFPTNELAPLAQYWVAEEFYRQGNYREALRNFQIIPENTNWPTTNLTYQARMMAGRSAFAAQLWKDAAGEKTGHFTILVNDRNCPDDIAAEAFYAYADTLRQQGSDPANTSQRFIEAREAFAKIPQLYPASRLVPLAWGAIGDCCLQLASEDPKQYENATNAYWKVITHPLADVSVRSLAEFGLGHALELSAFGKAPAESAALLEAAFYHYYRIVLGDNLRDKERPDPFSMERAGMAGARLKEEQKQWSVAINLYQRLQQVLIPLRPRLEEKINKAREQSRNENN